MFIYPVVDSLQRLGGVRKQYITLNQYILSLSTGDHLNIFLSNDHELTKGTKFWH